MLDVLEALFYTRSFWFTLLLLSIFLYLKFVVNGYWKRRGVPHEAPYIFIGNALPLVLKRSTIGNFIKQSYEKFKSYPFHGLYMFNEPSLIINDPELIRTILVKEHARFPDRGLYHNGEIDPLTNNLVMMPGKKWKRLREKLSPAFTAGKLKQMFSLFQEICRDLIDACDEKIKINSEIDMRNVCSRYTIDNMCAIAYGFKNNSLRNSEDDFERFGHMLFEIGGLRFAMVNFAPKIMELLRISLWPRDLRNFFTTAFDQAVKARLQSNIDRKDFIGALMQMMGLVSSENERNSQVNEAGKNDENKLSYSEGLAQPFIFFAAGYESSAATMTYCLYELALNPNIQKNLHSEIDEFVNEPDEFPYDAVINDLKYLNMVYLETMRKYPVSTFFTRQCEENFKIPGSNFEIEKGTKIIVSLLGLHYNSDVHADPETFDPSRFTIENISARDSCTYLPFGTGPRSCIGKRYADLQVKLGLLYLLSRYEFSVCDKTPIPMTYSTSHFTLTPDRPVFLELKKRKHISGTEDLSVPEN